MDAKYSRRDVVKLLGTSLVALPVIGCGGGEGTGTDGGSLADAGALDGGPVEGVDAGDAGSVAEDGGTTPDGGVVTGWASGGTASMVDPDSYPNPFTAAASCALYANSTLGPCFTSAPLRRDVSEGYPGLPVRLALQLLDASCAPISGARLEIWHTRNSGLYSEGPTSFCTSGDADAEAHSYFRGSQVSDADGLVAFDTCFPGWYSGRAIHIHFRAYRSDGGAATKVSQLFFPPALIEELFASHVDYAEFGQPDTPNARDSIYSGVGTSGIVEYERMSDGAMLAWKQIRIV
ncbi:MAG: protocatechuate 3,4-dioxygenase [Sandaracinus sp.]|nr:protocatechuate 3,4-dioxygenase [Sandaracinus sp.]MCB9614032.1 protocatechuate 3,4-dioxygenase [Sandaracinus sp.]